MHLQFKHMQFYEKNGENMWCQWSRFPIFIKVRLIQNEFKGSSHKKPTKNYKDFCPIGRTITEYGHTDAYVGACTNDPNPHLELI